MKRKIKNKLSKLLIGLSFLFLSWLVARLSPKGAFEPPPPPVTSRPDFTPQHPHDFDQAKRILRELYPKGREFYCACRYDLTDRHTLDFASCGFIAKSSRGHKFEWEHVVPASVYGRRFKEWTQGDSSCERQGQMQKGRNCARQASETFRLMEADLYNLMPAVGELNRARANFPYAEIPGEARNYGACDFEVASQRVEPRPQIRGDIARIYFYMDAKYPGFGILDAATEKLFERWDLDDPLDQTELDRLKAIEQVQGNSFFIGRLSSRSTVPSKRSL